MKTDKDLSLIKILVIFGEMILVNASFFLAFYLHRNSLSYSYFIENRNFLLFFNLCYFISISLWGVVLHKRMVRIEEILDKIFKLILSQSALLITIIILTNKLYEFNIKFAISLFVIEFNTCFIWRLSFRNVLNYIRTKEKNVRPIIILGAGNIASQLYNEIILNKTNGYKFLGFFDDRKEADFSVKKDLVKGNLQDVIPFLKRNNVKEILCALPSGDDRNALTILSYAENNLIRFYFIPDFKRFLNKKVRLQFLNNIPIVSLRSEPLESWFNSSLKRLFDLILSSIFLATVFPILLLGIGLGIKASSSGPIFFRQKRTGKNGKEFTCIKFRSMQINDDSDNIQATKGDIRVTKIGAFLRKTNLDETPQFINVFLGDMTLVGPRPHMVKQTDEYSALIDKYMLRHLASPGITGWAQVTGCRGETKDLQAMEKRILRDVWYLENWTFWLDLKIIFQTVLLMIKGDSKAY